MQGNVSQNFVTLGTIFLDPNSTASEKAAARAEFSHEVIQNCLKYVYLGCGIFAAGFLQVLGLVLRKIEIEQKNFGKNKLRNFEKKFSKNV